MRVRTTVALLAVIAFGDAAAGQDELTLTLRILTPAATLRPGAVMVVAVTASKPITGIEADAFNRTVRFWPTSDPTDWQALVGVPLETPRGSHELTVQATAHGRAVTDRVVLTIVPARFETRRLRVDQRFVNPPANVAGRIKREARTLADIFAHASSERLWREPFIAPLPGEATSSFGRRTILNGQSRGRHLGADFRAAEDTPVMAPNAGRVVLADDYCFSGNTVVLDHGDGLYSLLAHLSRIRVQSAADVQRGDVVGYSGATGRVTGPHLHWAVRLRGDSVDPLSLAAAANLLLPGLHDK